VILSFEILFENRNSFVSDARLWSASKGFGGGFGVCGDF
jgi:hypothetical protein